MKKGLVNAALILLFLCAAAPAETVIDFESPTYTVDTPINGQDGWVDVDNAAMIRANAALGSQAVEFPVTANYPSAIRDLDATYTSGKLRLTLLQKNLSGRSGYFVLSDPAGTPVLRVGTTTSNDFYCAEGPAGTVTGANPGGSARWLGMHVDIDLDNNTADVGYRELDGNLQPIVTDYALNPATVAKISLHNQKVAAMFDDILVTVPGPTAIDFEAPTYILDTPINGQDGWADGSNLGMIRYDAELDSQIIDFTDGVGAYRSATRELNDTYQSGKVRLTILQKNLSGRSGYLVLSGRSETGVEDLFMFGIRVTTGNFYCAGGVQGLVELSSPGGSTRWVGIQIEIDLDSHTADMSWHELGGPLVPLLTGYELNPGSISSIRLENKKVAAQFDDIQIGPYSTDPQTCQQVWDKGYGLPSDLNEDCHVDLADLAAFAAKWLDCADPQNPACNQ